MINSETLNGIFQAIAQDVSSVSPSEPTKTLIFDSSLTLYAGTSWFCSFLSQVIFSLQKQCAADSTQNLLISDPPHFLLISSFINTYQGVWPAEQPPTILSKLSWFQVRSEQGRPGVTQFTKAYLVSLLVLNFFRYLNHLYFLSFSIIILSYVNDQQYLFVKHWNIFLKIDKIIFFYIYA